MVAMALGRVMPSATSSRVKPWSGSGGTVVVVVDEDVVVGSEVEVTVAPVVEVVEATTSGGWVVVVDDVAAAVVELAGTSTEQPETSNTREISVKVHHFIGTASRIVASCAESGAAIAWELSGPPSRLEDGFR